MVKHFTHKCEELKKTKKKLEDDHVQCSMTAFETSHACCGKLVGQKKKKKNCAGSLPSREFFFLKLSLTSPSQPIGTASASSLSVAYGTRFSGSRETLKVS